MQEIDEPQTTGDPNQRGCGAWAVGVAITLLPGGTLLAVGANVAAREYHLPETPFKDQDFLPTVALDVSRVMILFGTLGNVFYEPTFSNLAVPIIGYLALGAIHSLILDRHLRSFENLYP